MGKANSSSSVSAWSLDCAGRSPLAAALSDMGADANDGTAMSSL